MIEESKDELQNTFDEPGNSHAVSSRNDLLRGSTENIQQSRRKTSTGERGDRIILRTGKLNRSQPSADPDGGTGGPDPPGKSQVIWVSVGNKQLTPPPPLDKSCPLPWKNWTPSGTLKTDIFL